MKKAVLLSLLVLSLPAFAEPATAKSQLIAKILKLQQPAIENLGRGVVEQPVLKLSQQAAMALQARVPADKREAVAKEIQADLKKYIDESAPKASETAVKLGPTTIGPLLDKNFTQAELKQLLGILESPVNRKFQQLGGEMQQALGQKLVETVGPQLLPGYKALEQSVAQRLGIETPKN